MNRQYSRQEYLDKIDMARQRLDRPAITTDIIAGFPGETDEDFAQTLDLVAQAGFSRIHVFPYSPRKGTAAALMKDSVTAEVKKNRCRQLRELAKKKASQFREQFVGENTVVLTEASGGKIVGRTERYFLVYFKTETDLKKNQIAEVTMLENLEDGMLAEVINTNHVS
jgi:threonylcarbamoyladenosine tRNA methylthiotransferase MtaB